MPKTESPFSILNRKHQIKKLQSNTFDLAIIGGGITGAGIALDAASRGMNVCLVEKNDFASGTSNKSTKLIHGGLRYLKQFEVGLVRESGSERAIVHKLAPHLVTSEKMLLPLSEGGTYGKIMTSIGLKVYDFLADVHGDDSRIMLDKAETLEKEPLLDKTVTIGGAVYAEYRTDDARLTLEVLKKAASFGATIINYCEMQDFNYNVHSKIESLNCIDYNSNHSFTIAAKSYISATGPWADIIRTKDHSINHKHLHLTKGVHLVFPQDKLPIKQSIYFDVDDGRMIFAIPRGRVTYVGTTDTNYTGNKDRVVATKSDVDYLLNAINKTFPEIHLTVNDVESNWAGLRPLIHEDDKAPSELSRKDELFVSDTGLISIAGGKLTGYRKMAQRALDAVLDQLNSDEKDKLVASQTEHITLVDPKLHTDEDVLDFRNKLIDQLNDLGVSDPYHAWYFCSNYGSQADHILSKSKDFENENILERLIRAELWFSINYEMVNSLSDFFVRRTGRLYFDISSVDKYRDIILTDCIMYLNWDNQRVMLENEKLEKLIQDATTYYDKEFE
ncbi:glycerol-3-phosphate dehydrogenase/oxidase [Tamlana sp. 2_MG-2023]|uniref:glycerol-3-phosphate dehydrogenase/oxidase n=1 Tax=unclassified Tamlana TaxID=2614803 RepID=UPI0026E32FFC|nr:MULTISPECIES: glycerol-3-phosphate dehydrogenase/oxidase [unclassified Tamlana]MDO6761129.1 glycerol-3-phosphate dehydrogenase/oxidase [Tamlana sp. 2_MG-2023]MDO6791538.1 glycerol-3-phosphate dehydrogenase/oxidase [Tamlana sp. 1_MG-2023]